MTGFTTLNEALQTAMAHPGRPQVGLCVHPFPTFAAETSILIPPLVHESAFERPYRVPDTHLSAPTMSPLFGTMEAIWLT